MPLDMIDVVVDSPFKITVEWSEVPTTTSVDEPSEWGLTPTEAWAVDVGITDVQQVDGTHTRLWFSHPVTFEGQYTVSCPGAFNGGGPAAVSQFEFGIPEGLQTAYAVGHDFPKGPFEGLTHMLGQVAETLIGRPMTRLVKDFLVGDTIAFVESTYAFPDKGAVFIGGLRYTYESRTAGSLAGMSKLGVTLLNVRSHKEVVFDELSIEPNRAALS